MSLKSGSIFERPADGCGRRQGVAPADRNFTP
jgi:hypothetical protein